MPGENVKRNLADRLDSVKLVPNNVVAGARVLMDRLTELKPVQGIAEAGKLVGEGILGFVDENCKITRRWTSEIRS